MSTSATLFEDLERICREIRPYGPRITFIHHENFSALTDYLKKHDWIMRVLKRDHHLDVVEICIEPE